jgi:cell division protein FtsI/penicillin-binding protein 2
MGRRAGVVVSALLAAALLAGCSSGPDASPVARSFLSDWAAGRLGAASRLTTSPAAAETALAHADSALDITRARLELSSTTTASGTATGSFLARLDLAGLGRWTYRGTLRLVQVNGRWRVAWRPSDVYPGLRARQGLARTRTLPPRAPILGAGGAALVTPQPVVIVGIVPARATSLTSTLATLAGAVGIDPARVQAVLQAAPPKSFVPVITLRRAAYEAAKAAIYSLPGVEFESTTEELAPTATFGLPVLGRVGPATADALARIGAGRYLGTDEVGLSGLELAYQNRLAGAPSGSVEIVGRSGRTIRVLHRFVGRPGQPLATTIDPAAESAAEAALTGTSRPAALVALRASTGAILAAASTPADSVFDRALDSEYPPGSSFKVVTTTALLASGTSPSTPVPCPTEAVIDGKAFHNFEGEAPGTVPFTTDFAISCNTAFVGLASKLAPTALPAAARSFGFGARWDLPLTYYSGQVPAPADLVEQAADGIGQGRVLASPLNMAVVAATVDAGRLVTPVLLADQVGRAPAGPALGSVVDAQLHALMRAVVTSGTGTAANLPGAPVYGKTGTAEFGSVQPLQTHAWFIAFRGDIAVAALVDGGGVGGRVAAPLVARFLSTYGGA